MQAQCLSHNSRMPPQQKSPEHKTRTAPTHFMESWKLDHHRAVWRIYTDNAISDQLSGASFPRRNTDKAIHATKIRTKFAQHSQR